MPLSAGDKLGPYEILAPIGAGGMGEVYRARDPRLNRDVAIKVSTAQFSERFAREAQAIAALNHPHICQIYDVVISKDAPNYLVMELVEGAPLRGPLPLEKATEYAGQILDALDAAHKKGITHRDLKPANILVTRQGIKLLDFGLAKQAGPIREGDSTVTQGLTGQGQILGTLQYMSPEQLQGKEVDARSDLFSFGCVLYELLTGKRAFEGASSASVIAAILEREPAPLNLSPPPERVIRTCLAKDPERRFQNALDLKRALNWALEQPAASAAPRASQLLAGVAALLLAALVALAFVHFRMPTPEARVVNTTILPPEGAAFDFVPSFSPPAISPDGRRLVFSARSPDGKTQLWIRPLNSRTAQPLAGTDGARFPFWSPDIKYIGFFAGGKLKTIDAAGGPAVTLADAPLGHGGSWSPEGVIVFSPEETGPLQRVPASGGAAGPATANDAGEESLSHHSPWFLPDGRHFLFQKLQVGGTDVSIQIASLDSKEVRMVARTNSNAIYAEGRLLFLRENTLMAQPFDAKRLAVIGDAVPVAEQVGSITVDAIGLFSASSAGLLAYQADTGAGLRRLTRFDRSGKPGGTLGDAANFRALELSPDGKSLATSVTEGGSLGLWIYDVARGLRTRFTCDSSNDDNPVWSPDGRSIAFRSIRKGHFDLYRKSSDRTGAEELLYADNLHKTPGSWSPDGRFLLYSAASSQTGDDVWALPLKPPDAGGAPQPFPFLQTPFIENEPRFSPDGRWVAYQSIESGRNEIYGSPFPGPGGKRQISTNGGRLPRWRRDGKKIFYVGPDAHLKATEVSVKGNTIEVGQAHALGISLVIGPVGYQYDVSADGQRFLVAVLQEHADTPPLTLVQNWAAGLKK